MPTKNPRVMVSLEPSLHEWIKQQAAKTGLSISNMIRDLVKDAYTESEDYYLTQEGEARLASFDRSQAVSHEDAWK